MTKEDIEFQINEQAAGSMKGLIKCINNMNYMNSDFYGSNYSAIVDLSEIQVINNFVTIGAWYNNNEMAHANRILDLTKHIILEDRK